ncbi:MAG: hypothetical protein ACE5JA_05325 [bacterium]
MKYLFISVITLSLLSLGCSKKETKAEPEAKLSIEPSGYYWLNLMPPVPADGPSFHAIFRVKVTNVGKGIARNVKAISADIYLIADDEESKFGRMELRPSPSTSIENDLLPGEEMTIEFGGSIPGATRVTPGLTVYGNVFLVWDSGHSIVSTPADQVMATR